MQEVAILDLDLSEFYEVGDLIDHHRDMRLDIEHMSYEVPTQAYLIFIVYKVGL